MLPHHTLVLFESSLQLDQKTILIPVAVIEVKNQQSKLIVKNTTDHSYTLRRNTCLDVVSTSPIICTMSSLSTPKSLTSVYTSSVSGSASPCVCYVCHATFLSNNDLYRHLREHIATLTIHITDTDNRMSIQNILWRYGKLFYIRSPLKINITLENAIDTGHHHPIYTAPYRRLPKFHQQLDNEVLKRSNQERIEPSTSPWCSPVVLVRKNDGNTRFCVDYRKLNDITVKHSFPLPRLDDIFDQLSHSTYFTKLDFKMDTFKFHLLLKIVRRRHFLHVIITINLPFFLKV